MGSEWWKEIEGRRGEGKRMGRRLPLWIPYTLLSAY